METKKHGRTRIRGKKGGFKNANVSRKSQEEEALRGPSSGPPTIRRKCAPEVQLGPRALSKKKENRKAPLTKEEKKKKKEGKVSMCLSNE